MVVSGLPQGFYHRHFGTIYKLYNKGPNWFFVGTGVLYMYIGVMGYVATMSLKFDTLAMSMIMV